MQLLLADGIILLPVFYIATRNCRIPWLATASSSFIRNMKLHIFPILSALLMLATAAQVPQKQVVVTYSKETPDSLLVEAKDAIKAAVCGT